MYGWSRHLPQILIMKANEMHSQIYVIKYSTCFGQVHCPLSGVSQYIIIYYFITHTNTCTHTHIQYIYIYIYIKKSKIYIKTVKTLLHISIIRSSSGSIRRTTITRPILNTVRLTHKHTTCCHSTKVNITK